MTTLIVVVINVIFILFVYIVFSRRLNRIEKQSMPDRIQTAMDGLLGDFNRAASRNIDLIEDRIKTLRQNVADAEKSGLKLEGLLNRAEALERRMEATVRTPVEVPAAAGKDTTALQARNALRAYSGKTVQHELEENLPPQQAQQPPAPSKKAARRKKPLARQIKDLSDAGMEPGAIAAELGLPREEVILKLRFLTK
jgi:Mg2+ and Co2+ transporter CorA